MRFCISARVFAFLLLATLAANGQKIELTGPLRRAPKESWVGAVPARLEWSYWVSGGAVLDPSNRGAHPGAYAGIGAEATFEALRYRGFPSGCYGRQRGDAEIRLGPWASAATRGVGGLVEGGMKVHFGGIFHASFGTWDLRLGSGYAAYETERASHVTATFAYGVRSALHRYPRDRRDQWQFTRPEPKWIAEVRVARLFVTARRGLSDAKITELVFGIELSPTFFLPPYSWWRLGGGPPY